MIETSKILIVEDDLDFFTSLDNSFRRLDISSHVSLENCADMSTAKTLITENQYIAYIIDGYLPDGNGLDLIDWMLTTVDKDSHVAFISSGFRDKESYQRLQQQLGIHCIIHKPLTEKDKDDLFNFCIEIDVPEELVDEPEFMIELKAKYRDSLPRKFDELEMLIKGVSMEASPENLNLLKVALHKISGSAGSYGFSDAGTICRKAENAIIAIIDSGKAPDLKWREAMESTFIQELKIAFQQ